MRSHAFLRLLALGVGLLPCPALAQWRADVRAEAFLFTDPTDASRLVHPEASLVLHALGSVEWDEGDQWFELEPFFRIDVMTGERTRLDLRQAKWTISKGDWELLAGMTEVYWGVAESRRVVDVVNQWYPVGSVAGYEKLGQPMIRGTFFSDWGTFALYLLPLFRERPFDGSAGTLYSSLPVTEDLARDDSDRALIRRDYALRWSHSLGAVDLGVAYFRGRDRDPRFEAGIDSAGSAVLIPVYHRASRTSLDLQWTSGAWLWKAEVVTAGSAYGSHTAAAGGTEYAFTDYLSAFAEYVYDDRGAEATTSYENDLYLGGRLLLHEGRLGAGLFADTRSGNRIAQASARRRLSDRLTLDVEGRIFMGDSSREPRFAPRQGSLLTVSLTAYY
jgi:hypothetical protein